MKKLILVFIFIVGLVVIGCSGGNNQEAEVQNTIVLAVDGGDQVLVEDFAFNPVEINVNVGDKVIWINNDKVKHTVTSDSGDELNSELIGNGERYEHVFNNIGEYSYYCKPHPYMKGKVRVVETKA